MPKTFQALSTVASLGLTLLPAQAGKLEITDIFISEFKPFVESETTYASVLLDGRTRKSGEIAVVGRAEYGAVVRSGPTGECDEIGFVEAGEYVALRSSSSRGWVRVLMVGGGHGYCQSYNFKVDYTSITNSNGYDFAPAPLRRVDRVYQRDEGTALQAKTNPPLRSTGNSMTYLGGASGHWISEVSQGGKYIELEDDSLWEVDPFDTIDSALWLTTEDIVVVRSNDLLYPYKLINKDNDESVNAKLIKQ